MYIIDYIRHVTDFLCVAASILKRNITFQHFLLIQAVCVNAVLAKIKNIFQEEESLRQNRESENFRKAFSEPALPQPMFSEGEITAKPYRSLPEKPEHFATLTKPPANKQSNKIQVLHSVFDQSAQLNE